MALYTVTAYVRPRRSLQQFVVKQIVINYPTVPTTAQAGEALRLLGYEVNSVEYIVAGNSSAAQNDIRNRDLDTLNAIDFTDATDSGFQKAVNRAIDIAAARGGGLVIVPDCGPAYNLTGPIVLKSNVYLKGAGKPKLKLVSGANCDVVRTVNAYNYFGTNTYLSELNFGIESLTLDGNASQQDAQDQDAKNGIALYAADFTIRDVDILNVKGHGIRSEYYQYGEPTGGLEAMINNVVIDRAGRHGWWNKGPHDLNADHVVVIDSSGEADNTYCGLYNEGYSNGRYFNFHGWHRSATTNRVKYQASSAGGCEFIACHFEGGRSQLHHRGNGDRVVACTIYAHMGAAESSLVLFEGSFNRHQANNYGGNESKDAYALQLGVTGSPAAVGNEIRGGYFSGFKTRTPLNFRNESNSFVQGVGYASAGGATTYGGSKSGSTEIDYEQTGTVINSKPPFQAVAQTADGTALGGNSRGTSATDLQTSRFQANQVASGVGSVIAGGYSNIAGGAYAVTAGGNQNYANGLYDAVLGGAFNQLGGGQSAAIGGSYATDRSVFGRSVWATGRFSVNGDAQTHKQVLRASTTDATATRLTADGAAIGGFNAPLLANNSAISFSGRIIARDISTGDVAEFTVSALIKRGASAATTSLVGSASVTLVRSDSAASTWAVAVTADTTRGQLAVTVTGQASTSIHWVCALDGVEVI